MMQRINVMICLLGRPVRGGRPGAPGKGGRPASGAPGQQRTPTVPTAPEDGAARAGKDQASLANTLRAMAMVSSMTASSCAAETKPASKAAGAR